MDHDEQFEKEVAFCKEQILQRAFTLLFDGFDENSIATAMREISEQMDNDLEFYDIVGDDNA